MPDPRVLSVGQCAFDHNSITRHLARTFQARTMGVATCAEALAALRSETFDLVLVNRISDGDGSRGLELIRALKADPELATVPVMLVSRYPDAQAEAEKLGALKGFGKDDLRSSQGATSLEAVLRPAAEGVDRKRPS